MSGEIPQHKNNHRNSVDLYGAASEQSKIDQTILTFVEPLNQHFLDIIDSLNSINFAKVNAKMERIPNEEYQTMKQFINHVVAKSSQVAAQFRSLQVFLVVKTLDLTKAPPEIIDNLRTLKEFAEQGFLSPDEYITRRLKAFDQLMAMPAVLDRIRLQPGQESDTTYGDVDAESLLRSLAPKPKNQPARPNLKPILQSPSSKELEIEEEDVFKSARSNYIESPVTTPKNHVEAERSPRLDNPRATTNFRTTPSLPPNMELIKSKSEKRPETSEPTVEKYEPPEIVAAKQAYEKQLKESEALAQKRRTGILQTVKKTDEALSKLEQELLLITDKEEANKKEKQKEDAEEEIRKRKIAAWDGRSPPSTPEEIEAFKEAMRLKYEQQQKENAELVKKIKAQKEKDRQDRIAKGLPPDEPVTAPVAIARGSAPVHNNKPAPSKKDEKPKKEKGSTCIVC